MSDGRLIIRLGELRFSGRMTLAALEWLQSETGQHPFALARLFNEEKDTPLIIRAVLMAALIGDGMALAEAAEALPPDGVLPAGLAVMRLEAFRALNAGLYVPDMGAEKDTGKKPARLMRPIWLCLTFMASACASALRHLKSDK